MQVNGTDVSSAQRPSECDWQVAYANGLRFVFVKGSEGAGGDAGAYVDKAAVEHVSLIRHTPLLLGMFHVARPDNRFNPDKPGYIGPDGFDNGVFEARHAIATAVQFGLAWPGSLPLVIDLEKYVPTALGTTLKQRDDFVRGLVLTVRNCLDRTPIVYAGEDYWRSQHSQALALELRRFGVLLWQVDYTKSIDPTESIAGWPWSIWQHSGGGDFAYAPPWPGLPHPIDQNIYRGTLAELAALTR